MKEILEKFYRSFHELDADGMIACYHDEIIFEDPAFGILKGEKAGNMWRMLCESQKGKDFRVAFSKIDANDKKGSAQWEVFYSFGKTGRKVHNIIQSEFDFQDEKIVRHTDTFDLYRWSKQAMGITGVLIGWTPYFRKKLQTQTNKVLSRFEESL